MNQTATYLFDPLCGWYCGASRAIGQIIDTPQISDRQLAPTGPRFTGKERIEAKCQRAGHARALLRGDGTTAFPPLPVGERAADSGAAFEHPPWESGSLG